MMKATEVKEDGIYLLSAGRLVSVWVRSTRLDGEKELYLWRDAMDWSGNVYRPEDLEAYKVNGRLHLSLPCSSVETYV